MRTIEMILMTKSSKYGAYCVAGFDVSNGRWVRLVSEDEETHGAITDEMLFDGAAGRCAEVLDKVSVETERDIPTSLQNENVLVAGNDKIRILGRATIREAMRIHPCEERDALFFSHRYIVERDITEVHHSLEFIRAENLHLYTMTGSSGKPKYKVDFECGGRRYTLFAMTDPEYYGKKEMIMESAALVLSITDDEWTRANGHYIYVARIFELSRRRSRMKFRKMDRKQIVSGAILAGAAAGMIVMGLWLMKMDRVYLSRHIGARYHMTRECELLNNPQAAWEVPLAAGWLMGKPCGLCAGK